MLNEIVKYGLITLVVSLSIIGIRRLIKTSNQIESTQVSITDIFFEEAGYKLIRTVSPVGIFIPAAYLGMPTKDIESYYLSFAFAFICCSIHAQLYGDYGMLNSSNIAIFISLAAIIIGAYCLTRGGYLDPRLAGIIHFISAFGYGVFITYSRAQKISITRVST